MLETLSNGPRDLAEVPHLDAAATFEARRADALVRELGLRLGQRHAERFHAVVLDRVHDEPAPAAADVEEPFALAQPQLAADVVELLLLRRVEVVVRCAEVRARVDHPPVEEEPVELGVEVVVVVDGLRQPLGGVAPPAQTGRPAACADAPVRRQLQRPLPEPELLAAPPLPLDQQPVRERQHRLEVALDVDVAVQIRLRERQLKLARRREHRPQRTRVLEDDREPCVDPGVGAPLRPVPEPDGEVSGLVAAEELIQERERPLGGLGALVDGGYAGLTLP